MRRLFIWVFLLSGICFSQNVRYDAPFPSITTIGATPYLIANVPPVSPRLAVCLSPANTVPCSNYANTFTALGVVCPGGQQDTPQPALTSACQTNGDAQGNIGFWAAPGTYDYTVCVGNSCFGPYTITLRGGSATASGVANQFAIFTGTSAIASDPNLDDGNTTPSTITATETIATPQLTLTGSGGLFATSAGSVLPALGGSNGGYGVFTGGLPQLNVANAWFYTPYVTVNGTALTENKVNFNNTTPAAPTNGINIQCQVDVNGNLSCAMVGDGNAAHAFCGNGTFSSCVASGSTPLSGITAAGGANTIANGNNPQVWNWAQTTASQTAFTFGETSAATGAGDVEVGIATAAGSLALPLSVSSSLTGSQALSTVSITPTWNTTGAPQGALVVNPTNTASGAGTLIATFQLSGAHQIDVDKLGDLLVANSIGGTTNTTNLNICGGNAANNCGPPNLNSQAGGLLIQGQDTSSNGTGAKGGFNILRGGMLTNATPSGSALMGTAQVVTGFLKGTAIAAVGDVVGMTTTAFTVTDCSHTGPCVNIAGIASNTSNPIGVIMYGTAPVSLDNTAVIGDTVCMGTTTDGKAHDNGLVACTLGTSIGVVIATSGSIQGASGASNASTTLSTSLPLVALHISQ